MLLDCPPVLPVSDPLAVAQFVDGVIMLSVLGQTKAHNLREACSRLDRVGADVIGIILNGVPTGRGRYPYQYYRRYEADPYQSDGGGDSDRTTAGTVANLSSNGRVAAPVRTGPSIP